jgi:hypothetical protein
VFNLIHVTYAEVESALAALRKLSDKQLKDLQENMDCVRNVEAVQPLAAAYACIYDGKQITLHTMCRSAYRAYFVAMHSMKPRFQTAALVLGLVKELLGHKDDSSAHYYASYTHNREMASRTYECAADDTSDSDNGSVSADTVSSDDVNVGVKCCDGDTVIIAEEQTVRAPVVRFASCGTGSNDHGDVVIVSAIETQINALLAKWAVSGFRQDIAAVVGINAEELRMALPVLPRGGSLRSV